MSFRTQHGQLSAALAREDDRQRTKYHERLVCEAIAEYRRTGQVPDLPDKLLEEFTNRVFLRQALAEERRSKAHRQYRERQQEERRTTRLNRKYRRFTRTR